MQWMACICIYAQTDEPWTATRTDKVAGGTRHKGLEGAAIWNWYSDLSPLVHQVMKWLVC